jgi:hypothetical protein
LSFGLRLSAFSVSAGFGGTVSVTPDEGGTEALGTTLSRCLSFPLSRVSTGVVAGAMDALGVVTGVSLGETLSFGLAFSFSGVIAGLEEGVTEAATLGAGEISRFLSLSLSSSLSLAGETPAVAAGLTEAAGVAAAGLAPVAGVALAVEVTGADAAGLAAVSSRTGWTLGGGTVLGSSAFIFCLKCAWAF